jgi:hypothetical protein
LILKLGVHLGQLSACIRNFLEALNDCLMALHRSLNGLSGSLFTLSQLFQLGRIRLLLMKQLLIHVGGLIRLHDKLLDHLLAVVHLLGDAVVLKLIVHWYTPWIGLASLSHAHNIMDQRSISYVCFSSASRIFFKLILWKYIPQI